MPPQVIVNNFTTQKPLTVLGNTGVQLLGLIPASRVFIKASDLDSAAPIHLYSDFSFKTRGQTPAGWKDLGIMDAPGKLTYTKDIAKVQTGIDKVTRKTYAKSKEATLDFSLWQTDDYILSALGFQGSVTTAGSSMTFLIGQEDVFQCALLCVYCNKLDGKELHVYHPNASLSVSFDSSNDKLLTKVSVDLTAFTPEGGTTDALYSLNVFGADDAVVVVTPPPVSPSSLYAFVPSSAAPVFDGTAPVKTFEIDLTGDVTAPTFINFTVGELYTFFWVQDGIGGHVVTFPSLLVGATQPSPTPNSVTVQTFLRKSDGTLEAIGPGTFN
jgi:hypothetical protein